MKHIMTIMALLISTTANAQTMINEGEADREITRIKDPVFECVCDTSGNEERVTFRQNGNSSQEERARECDALVGKPLKADSRRGVDQVSTTMSCAPVVSNRTFRQVKNPSNTENIQSQLIGLSERLDRLSEKVANQPIQQVAPPSSQAIEPQQDGWYVPRIKYILPTISGASPFKPYEPPNPGPAHRPGEVDANGRPYNPWDIIK